ncbi:MAG TPA: serine hydrolase domain-containing protein [Vicinamibacterales bacterium]|nr:serine hydrolase domain-containing protein [Vicinamibacterales bacterium]
MRIVFALCVTLCLAVPLGGQQSDIRAHIEAYVKALSTGSAEQFEAMAKVHFAPDLLTRTASQRAAMVARVHDDFGIMDIARTSMTGATHADLEMHSATNSMPLTIAMEFEPQPPYRITQVSLRAGGPGGGPAGGRGGAAGDPPPLAPPPITAGMSAAELSTVLDGYLGNLARTGGFAGVVIVSKIGEPQFQKSYGVADRERNVPMSPGLRFNYASIGKAFTKTAIGQLISSGKLKLTDTIGALLPDYPNAEAKPATIDQLLNFRVGVADFFGEAFAAADKARFQSNHDYYLFVAPQPLKFAPGARTEYCNGCYIVLGEIIARVSGVPYERYIQDHVFAPAGMTTAGFLAYGDPDVAPPYTRRTPDAPWSSAIGMHGRHGSAAGGAFGTVRDLLAFDTAIRTHVLIDAKTTAWFFDNPADERAPRALDAYGIAGGATGANASLESDGTWAVITLGNLDPPNAVRVGTAIAGALRGEPRPPSQGPGANALGAIVGTWQSDVTNGTSARSACAWTPQHAAVVCDQTVTTPQGVQHATNLYSYDPASGRYVYYGLNRVGDVVNPVPLTIEGAIWTYGGQSAGPDGVTYRTINDFSAGTSYTWKRQSTRDGTTWTTIAEGRSTRVGSGPPEPRSWQR